MAIAFVQGNRGNLGGGSTGTVTFSSNVTSGNTVIIWVHQYAAGNVSASDGTNTYNVIVGASNNETILWAKNVVGGFTTVTISGLDNSNPNAAHYAEFSGLGATPTVHATSVSQGANVAGDGSTDLFVAGAAGSTSLFTTDSGWSAVVAQFSTGSPTLYCGGEYLITSTTPQAPHLGGASPLAFGAASILVGASGSATRMMMMTGCGS
jgi:hypothetical protein